MKDPLFEARNARYIYLRTRETNSTQIAAKHAVVMPVHNKKALTRQQTIALLEPRQSSYEGAAGIDLWLLCPPLPFQAKVLLKKIDTFALKRKSYVNGSYQERKPYR